MFYYGVQRQKFPKIDSGKTPWVVWGKSQCKDMSLSHQQREKWQCGMLNVGGPRALSKQMQPAQSEIKCKSLQNRAVWKKWLDHLLWEKVEESVWSSGWWYSCHSLLKEYILRNVLVDVIVKWIDWIVVIQRQHWSILLRSQSMQLRHRKHNMY